MAKSKKELEELVKKNLAKKPRASRLGDDPFTKSIGGLDLLITPTTEGRDLNVKETPSTARAKRGRPKEINRVVTKTSQSGLREGLTRATFIIREDTLDRLKERAYDDRKKLKDLVTEALNYYLDNTTSDKEAK